MSERFRHAPLRVLTWHVHGNYLYYLSQVPHEFHLVTLPGHPPGHAGRVGSLPWGENVHEAPAAELAGREFDCVLYQSRRHFEHDREILLTPAQRNLPAIYLEHDPPQEHPTETRHPAAGLVDALVHVTPFNALMWDNGETTVHVIEHAVMLPDGVRYQGDVAAGIVVVNNLRRRGRRLGRDVFEYARGEVPLQLVGMDSEALGGAGEVPNMALACTMARYRFFFNPIRYTSLGLAVVEAMTAGLPIVALATTELPTVIRNEVNGYIDTRPRRLVDAMKWLLEDPDTARRWGAAARETALARFGMPRFIAEWKAVLAECCDR